MYFYIYKDDKDYQKIILDDLGIPVQKTKISLNDCQISNMMMKLENDDNLLVVGEAYDMDQFSEVVKSNQIRENVYIYIDEKVSDVLSQLKSEDDWEKFFETNDIVTQTNSTSSIYLFH